MFRMIVNVNEVSTSSTKAQIALADRLKIEDIVRRAYEIHRERGGWFGFDSDDLAQAWGEWPSEGSSAPLSLMDSAEAKGYRK